MTMFLLRTSLLLGSDMRSHGSLYLLLWQVMRQTVLAAHPLYHFEESQQQEEY